MKSDLATLIIIGKRAFEEKDFFRAEKLLREALEGGADYPDIHHRLGLICHQWGKMDDAIGHFGKSIALNPEYTEALLSLAITLNDLGRYDEAQEAYRKANASVAGPGGEATEGSFFRGKIANLHTELGKLYMARGQHEEAIREYRKALGVAPDFPDLRVKLAVALREAGRLEEALIEIERALGEHPGQVAALAQHGMVLFLLGRKDRARQAWEDALHRDPDNRLLRLYLNTLNRESAR